MLIKLSISDSSMLARRDNLQPGGTVDARPLPALVARSPVPIPSKLEGGLASNRQAPEDHTDRPCDDENQKTGRCMDTE
jgi:hypothetical protein